mmetsp:Transcript_1803/g.2483  ORF Transcript_1803/g.2483 Transcript_1803/m.2483 type:complete len:294 (+) Transcript_1803:112-993(+)
MSTDTKEVSVLHDLIAGGVAGSASVIVGHPFDTIKVRLQTSSTALSLSSVGSFFSLFRGLTAPLSIAAVINALVFAAYGASSRWWDQNVSPPSDDLQHDTWEKAFICGTYAGFCQSFVICPMEVLKCRLQVQSSSEVAAYRGPTDAARAIIRSQGFEGLYRGFGCTLMRELPAYGAYFAMYDAVKDRANTYFDSHGSSSEQHRWVCSAFAGGVSGSFTWIIIYPFDVIKTRIQTAPFDAPRTTTLSVGRSIVAEHGWRYMFRGLGITLVRAFPVNGIIFPVYEFILTHLTNLD